MGRSRTRSEGKDNSDSGGGNGRKKNNKRNFSGTPRKSRKARRTQEDSEEENRSNESVRFNDDDGEVRLIVSRREERDLDGDINSEAENSNSEFEDVDRNDEMEPGEVASDVNEEENKEDNESEVNFQQESYRRK